MGSLIIAGSWALGSVLWVEVVRDFYHMISYYWSPLYRLHIWHHRVFRPDLTPTSEEIYRQAHWYNDVPESCVMLGFSFLFWGVAHFSIPEYHWVTLLGSIYTFGFLLGAIARGMGVQGADELTDLTHLPGAFLTPPSNWKVNRPYHWPCQGENWQAK